MRIRSVDVRGVAGLKDQKFDFGSAEDGRKIVLLFGGTGSGKTTLLEAIALAKEQIGTYGGGPDRNLVPAGRDTAKVSIQWEIRDEECEEPTDERIRLSESFFGDGPIGGGSDWDDLLRSLLSTYGKGRPKVEYFHSDRQLPTGNFIQHSSPIRSDRLTTSNRKFQDLEAYLIDLGLSPLEGPDSLRRIAFAKAFHQACPTKQFVGTLRRATGPVVAFTADGEELFSLAELSSAEKQALIFVASFFRSSLDHSVVLIDCPELHFPEGEAAVLLEVLASLGQNQLIVTTSSATLAAKIERSSVIRLGGR